MPAVADCPKGYWWTSTRDAWIRVVRKVAPIKIKREGFDNLLPHEILPTTEDNIQLEFAFYSLRKKVQALMADDKLKCGDTRAMGSQDKIDISLQAH